MQLQSMRVENLEPSQREIRAAVLQNILAVSVVPAAPMETKMVMNGFTRVLRAIGKTME